jgi:hypothetical protein
MEHSFAVEHQLVEQYLLEELSPEIRDEFEDHYFGCPECAAEVRETSEFLRAVRAELQRPQLISKQSAEQETKPVSRPSSTRNLLQWRPAFTIAALAACLIIVLYQNTITFPHLRGEVASLNQPEVFPSLSLVGGNSRGGDIPSVTLNDAKTLLLQVDIPSQDQFTGYTCNLYSPQHQLLWTVRLSPGQVKDTVSLRAPLGSQSVSGTYSLQVQGHQGSSATNVELASYTFRVSAGQGH